jgi:hypothetical protein
LTSKKRDLVPTGQRSKGNDFRNMVDLWWRTVMLSKKPPSRKDLRSVQTLTAVNARHHILSTARFATVRLSTP